VNAGRYAAKVRSMIIEIRNYLAASHLLNTEPSKWTAIVILDSQCNATDFVANHTTAHLLLRFDDITTPRYGKRMVDSRALQSALDFAADQEQLIVSCRAGQSRSAAVAHAICFQNNGATTANQILNPRRHYPNRHVIETVAPLLDDPTYLTTFDEWAREHANIKILDYFDEIKAEFDELEAQGARNLIVTP
jgi:predicted protein tyrosine phosphatase